jgi:hypothetical protein
MSSKTSAFPSLWSMALSREERSLSPARNEWGIPELDLAACADRLVPPVTKWGTRRRDRLMEGTWHAYCDDFKCTHWIREPEQIAATGCHVAVEPNLSTSADMPAAKLLWITYCKRLIAQYWQDLGIKLIVDLNVAPDPRAYAINFLGVPRGWTAYATRAHRGQPFEAIEAEYRMAVDHAETDGILFVVFGGGRKRIGRFCRDHGWPWVPEHRQVVAGLERPYAER